MIEVEELVRLRILENDVEHLHRFLDKGMLSEDMVRLIFGWKKKEEKEPEPVSTPALVKTIVPPPPKPMTSKKGEMMAKVKSLHLKGLNSKQIAEKTGLSDSTVSTYKKEMGLIGEASLTLLNSPGNCSGATAVGN